MAAMVSEKVLGPATPPTPPISQSMDGHNSPRRFSGDTPFDEAIDRTSSSTPSPSRQLDPQIKNQLLSRLEEYRQLFRLPPDEVLVQDFNCALQENFLLQGHMYLFVHCVCFYSNLFGFETKKIIPFREVTSVRRANAVAVFPTAIEIIAGEKKYFFTSFLSRDEAFRLINDGWLQHKNGPSVKKDQQEPNLEGNSEAFDNNIVEELDDSRSTVDDSQPIESDGNAHMSDSTIIRNCEPAIALTSSNVQVREEEIVEAVESIESSSPETSSAWKIEDTDAPGVPECYTKVAESRFPIQAEDFFNLFFSDNGVSFQDSFHGKCGDKDFKCTSWRKDEKCGHTRDVSFQHPIKIYFGARFGSCQEKQKYRVYRNSHLIVDTSQDISDVPYGDYFSVEGRWDVESESNDSMSGCILRVYTNVAFSKKTMWKGKIVQSTVEECREAYQSWIDLAHEVLKLKNLEKKEDKQVNSRNAVDTKSSAVGLAQLIPDSKDTNKVSDAQQGIINHPSVGSPLADIFTRISTPLKLRNSPTQLLLIILAIILVLMQISIVVLLSRPQRIHVIPQGNCMGGSTGEGLASISKQISYLREEMHFTETLLEKMMHEHGILKRKLRELELFNNQRF